MSWGSSFQEPWLVDKATLQYPEHIPTLVLDVDKAQLLANGTRSLPTYAASNGPPLAGDFAFTTWQQKGAGVEGTKRCWICWTNVGAVNGTTLGDLGAVARAGKSSKDPLRTNSLRQVFLKTKASRKAAVAFLFPLFPQEIPHYYEVVLFSDDVFPVQGSFFGWRKVWCKGSDTHRFEGSRHSDWNLGAGYCCKVALDIASKWNIPACARDAVFRCFSCCRLKFGHTHWCPNPFESCTPSTGRSLAFCIETSARSVSAANISSTWDIWASQ